MTKPTSAKAAGQPTPTLRQRAAQARDAAGRFIRRAVEPTPKPPEPVDWDAPPPGFMASPAIGPTSFARVEDGIRIEANRLLGIALAEQRRRQTMGIEGHSKPWDAADDARTRRALHLDALAAIACPGTVMVDGTRYVPESEHAHAEREGRVIAGGIDHRDGTISYCDAGGTLRRRSIEHWVNFMVMHLHAKVQGEIARRRIVEANHLTQAEHAVWEAGIRQTLRADAVFALAFHPQRAFAAAEALRTGAEPIDAEMRARDDADLLALAPQLQAAFDLYALRVQEQAAVEAAADDRPGPMPDGAGEDWQAWRSFVDAWRERTSIAAAEEASTDAFRALGLIEDRIATLPAASLVGLKLKARVAQSCDDINAEWPDGLGEGLARDILAYVEPPAQVVGPSPVDRIDFASLSLEELQTAHDVADLVGGVAYATTWQGRCQIRSARGLVVPLNPIGDLMHWLGDALTDVETAARNEAERRTALDRWDRETRLELLAPWVIQNGDPEEIGALARELSEHAAAEARGE